MRRSIKSQYEIRVKHGTDLLQWDRVESKGGSMPTDSFISTRWAVRLCGVISQKNWLQTYPSLESSQPCPIKLQLLLLLPLLLRRLRNSSFLPVKQNQ
jgi:hypothetical protein